MGEDPPPPQPPTENSKLPSSLQLKRKLTYIRTYILSTEITLSKHKRQPSHPVAVSLTCPLHLWSLSGYDIYIF